MLKALLFLSVLFSNVAYSDDKGYAYYKEDKRILISTTSRKLKSFDFSRSYPDCTRIIFLNDNPEAQLDYYQYAKNDLGLRNNVNLRTLKLWNVNLDHLLLKSDLPQVNSLFLLHHYGYNQRFDLQILKTVPHLKELKLILDDIRLEDWVNILTYSPNIEHLTLQTFYGSLLNTEEEWQLISQLSNLKSLRIHNPEINARDYRDRLESLLPQTVINVENSTYFYYND